MSKRKKSRKAKRKVNNDYKTNKIIKDLHHIFYQGRYYKKCTALHELRDYWYCKIYIPKNTLHKKIHHEIEDVPAPKEVNAKNALRQLKMLESYGAISNDDNLERRLLILSALFDCVEQPTADALYEQLYIAREFYKGLS